MGNIVFFSDDWHIPVYRKASCRNRGQVHLSAENPSLYQGKNAHRSRKQSDIFGEIFQVKAQLIKYLKEKC